MIYEILIRGSNTGKIVGGHAIRFNSDGSIGVAEPIPMVGQDLDFDGILPESLQNIVPLQEIEARYNAEITDAKTKFDADLSGLTQQLAEANQQIEQRDATIAQLQSRLDSANQQVVSQEEILRRMEALEQK
jgi:peptidoglycan hydrolase CwlO-like protein